MTDKEIIKALECCESHTCFGCPFYADMGYKCKGVDAQLIDLITRQQAEIEGLKEENEKLGNKAKEAEESLRSWMETQDYGLKLYKKLGYRLGVKEFKERLLQKGVTDIDVFLYQQDEGIELRLLDHRDIEEIEREMVGADNGKT